MSADDFVTIDGAPCVNARVWIPNRGAWSAEVDLVGDSLTAARVTLNVGGVTFRGTVASEQSGAYAAQRRLRIVAGAGGWSQIIAPRGYHSDAGVKARLVAEDAARDAGETLGGFVPGSERLGPDYARAGGWPAARTLEDAAGAGVAWWVDYDGVTHVGPRPAEAVEPAAYDVLAYDPRNRIATLAAGNLGALTVGATLTKALEAPAAIRELEIVAEPGELRVRAWLGGSSATDARLAGLLRSLVGRLTPSRLWGVYRYRVVRMAADGRVELQSVRPGMPNLAPISQWPGVAGVHAELAQGAEVLVQFADGDASQPIVTHYTGKGGAGFVPVTLTLGGASGAPAARQDDAVEVLLAPAVVSGTLSGAPFTGVITFPSFKALGKITGGSSRVKVAT